MYGTSDQEGSTGLFVQVMTYKFGCKIEDVEDRLNEFLEVVRRYDEANGTDPVPDQVKNACIISNTPEPLKTHLQLNVAKLGNFNALRVTTENHLRSRRIFKTTSAGNTRRRFNGSRCRFPERERQRKIRQGQEGWQERKRKPLRQRLRGNDSRTLTFQMRMSKLWKVWTQSI